MNVPKRLLLGAFLTCFAIAQKPAAVEEIEVDPTVEPIGGNHQWIEVFQTDEDVSGRQVERRSSFLQLELGLNYKDRDGKWQPAEERFEEEQGWAVARKGQHYVALFNNLNAAGSVHLEQSDGKQFRSTVQGLAYFDARSGEAVLIAEIQDCTGKFWTENQVVYPDAFSGLLADVRYSYHKWGFEQDIILREALPDPASLGMDPSTTRLEVWTEFFEGTDPVKEEAVLNAEAVAASSATPLVDESLDFGAMRIGLGRAFKLGEEADTLSFVAKRWNITPEGRRFLIETVELDAVGDGSEGLIPNAGGAALRKPYGNRAQAMREIPRQAKAPASIETARWEKPTAGLLARLHQPGFVVDYTTINYTTNSMNFRGDQTYYVSGLVTCNATTTFEGGAVIKYTNTASARIEIGGGTVWPTDNTYRPIVFTAKDDNTVGETITGSTGTPSGYYADVALKWNNATTAVKPRNLRFSHAKTGIALNAGSGHIFSHIQFVNCESGMKPTSTDFGLHNALFSGVTYIFNGSSATGRVEHATVNGATALNYNSTFGSGNLRMTNSIVAAVTTLGTITATNKVAFLTSASGVFASQVAGGAHYLAAGSPYRDVGVGISTNLGPDMPRLTTYAPATIIGPITSAAELSPLNSRDTNTLDLGYHYVPIDYLFSADQGVIVTNATITLRNGVVISHDEQAAFNLRGNSSFVGKGLPHKMNVMAFYTTVQEKKSANHDSSVIKYPWYSIGAYNSGTRSLSVEFTSIEGATIPIYNCLYWDDGYVTQAMLYRDCQFVFADTTLNSVATNQFTVSLINNLWIRPAYSSWGPFPHFIANQTVSGGSTSIEGASIDWRDSLLHSTAVNLDSLGGGGVTNQNNLFVNLTSFSSSGSNVSCITNSPFNFTLSTLGPWYHSSTTGVNQGSRTAGAASLYHHTVKTDQSKDASPSVDIGFHYVAMNGNNPIDTDSDGVPDYLEDANGDGTLNNGETSISNATDLGLSVIITEPKSGQNLP